LLLQIVAAPKGERKFVDLALPIAENDQVVARLQYLHHPGSKKSLNPICTICEILYHLAIPGSKFMCSVVLLHIFYEFQQQHRWTMDNTFAEETSQLFLLLMNPS
jgi:hypothetical protein